MITLQSKNTPYNWMSSTSYLEEFKQRRNAASHEKLKCVPALTLPDLSRVTKEQPRS